MDFKVVFKESFIADLEVVVGSIAQHDRDAAYRIGSVIIGLAESLDFFPERYPRVRNRPDVRRFIVKKHFKVFYRIKLEARVVEVLRCWDGRRERDPFIP